MSEKIIAASKSNLLKGWRVISDDNSSNTVFSENLFDIDRANYNFNVFYEYKTDINKLLIAVILVSQSLLLPVKDTVQLN